MLVTGIIHRYIIYIKKKYAIIEDIISYRIEKAVIAIQLIENFKFFLENLEINEIIYKRISEKNI